MTGSLQLQDGAAQTDVPSPNGYSSMCGNGSTAGDAKFDLNTTDAQQVVQNTKNTAQNQVVPPLQQYQQVMKAAATACDSPMIAAALQEFAQAHQPMTQFLGEQPFDVTNAGTMALEEYGSGDQQMMHNAQSAQDATGAPPVGPPSTGSPGGGNSGGGFTPPPAGSLKPPDFETVPPPSVGSPVIPPGPDPGTGRPGPGFSGPVIVGGILGGGAAAAVVAQQPWRWVKGEDGKFRLEGDVDAYHKHASGFFSPGTQNASFTPGVGGGPAAPAGTVYGPGPAVVPRTDPPAVTVPSQDAKTEA